MTEPSHLESLKRQFGIPGIAQIVPGNGGLPTISITTAACSAEIYLHGAQVTSWQPAGAEEVLFLSEHSHWQDGRAIRGGIPICFPWFRAKADDPKAPAHGFVRTRLWQLNSISAEPDGSVSVALSTQSDDASRRWWPHEFHIAHRITVGKRLDLDLTVRNTGTAQFSFEEALHTYFRVGDVHAVRVRGLDGASYLDNTDGNRENLQSGDVIFAAATDSAYIHTGSELDLVDSAVGRILRTEKQNSGTAIVWNPWQQGAAALSDLGDDEWQCMACVEAGNILASAVTLAPGAEHTLRASLSALPQ